MSKNSAISSIENTIGDREDKFEELVRYLFNYFESTELEKLAEFIYDENNN